MVALALLMEGGWPIRCCGTVAGFEIVAMALLVPIVWKGWRFRECTD